MENNKTKTSLKNNMGGDWHKGRPDHWPRKYIPIDQWNGGNWVRVEIVSFGKVPGGDARKNECPHFRQNSTAVNGYEEK